MLMKLQEIFSVQFVFFPAVDRMSPTIRLWSDQWSDPGLLIIRSRRFMANGKLKNIVDNSRLNTKKDNSIAFIRVTTFMIRWYKDSIEMYVKPNVNRNFADKNSVTLTLEVF